jgi:hypothetical protein
MGNDLPLKEGFYAYASICKNMEKEIWKEEDLKNIIVETPRQNKLTFETWISDRYFIYIVFAFILGAVMIMLAWIITPINLISITNQICRNYGGYVISYKYNFFNSNFDSVICKNSYGYINAIFSN